MCHAGGVSYRRGPNGKWVPWQLFICFLAQLTSVRASEGTALRVRSFGFSSQTTQPTTRCAGMPMQIGTVCPDLESIVTSPESPAQS